MIKVFEYECPEHGRFEQFEKEAAGARECPTCGTISERRQSATRSKLEGWSGAFPTAADKWARMHEEAGRKPSQYE